MEKWTNIFENIYEFIKSLIQNIKGSLEKLKLNTRISSDLSWLKQQSEEKKSEWDESKKTNNTETLQDNKDNTDNTWDSKWKDEKSENKEDSKDKEETPTENLSTDKLKSFFEKNSANLSVEKIDNKDFFEISYTDKNSNSKVKGIIPIKWNWDSNIYMPWDRSGIAETMKQKNFKQQITDKNSKKARFIFEWDADKIKDWTNQPARYNNVINNFEKMISPMKSVGNNPTINIIWHSRAGASVNRLIGKYWFISSYIIIDWTYWAYKNVMQSKIPGKIFYTSGTKKHISNYENKPNIEVSWEYVKLGHEAIVSKVLFDTTSTNQELFA